MPAKQPPWRRSLARSIDILAAASELGNAELCALLAEAQKLKRAGAIEYARLHFRDDHLPGRRRYAVLNVNPPGGERKRHYVGADPARIAKAERAVANGRRLTDVMRRIDDVERSATAFASAVERVSATAPFQASRRRAV